MSRALLVAALAGSVGMHLGAMCVDLEPPAHVPQPGARPLHLVTRTAPAIAVSTEAVETVHAAPGDRYPGTVTGSSTLPMAAQPGPVFHAIDDVDVGALPLHAWSLPADLSQALVGKPAMAQIWIDARGRVTKAVIQSPDLNPDVRKQLQASLEATRFTPAIRQGRNVASYRQIELAATPIDAI